ncbi:MAG: DNA mismatch repair protein MutL, partial [Maribacter sp.]
TLYAILRSTIKHSLGQFSVVPSLDFEKDQNLETPYNYKDKNVVEPGITVDSDFNPFREVGQRATGNPGYKKQHSKGWENLYAGLESRDGKEEAFSSIKFESESITGSFFEAHQDNLDSLVTTFQLRRKYIVTTIKSGMVVIDQNRAHQRILYERFLRNITIDEAISQQLLFPLQLSFSKTDIDVLKEIKDGLTTVGFLFSKIEGEEVCITGVPPIVSESEVGMVLDQLISDFQMQVIEDSFSQTDILSKTLAKTLAVKTGEVLNNASQMALVNDLFACKESRWSPFNKPVYVTITENDIDKKFI